MKPLAQVLAGTLPTDTELGGPEDGIRVRAVQLAVEIPVRLALVNGRIGALTTRRLQTGFDGPPTRIRATFVRLEEP